MSSGGGGRVCLHGRTRDGCRVGGSCLSPWPDQGWVSSRWVVFVSMAGPGMGVEYGGGGSCLSPWPDRWVLSKGVVFVSMAGPGMGVE